MIYFEIKQNDEPLSIADLKIDGQDLLTLEIPEGRAVGVILQILLDFVLENPKLNVRETLLKKVGELNGGS